MENDLNNLITEYQKSSEQLINSLKTILGNFFDLYDIMISKKAISFEDIKNKTIDNIKNYDNIMTMIKCDELSNRVKIYNN